MYSVYIVCTCTITIDTKCIIISSICLKLKLGLGEQLGQYMYGCTKLHFMLIMNRNGDKLDTMSYHEFCVLL